MVVVVKVSGWYNSEWVKVSGGGVWQAGQEAGNELSFITCTSQDHQQNGALMYREPTYPPSLLLVYYLPNFSFHQAPPPRSKHVHAFRSTRLATAMLWLLLLHQIAFALHQGTCYAIQSTKKGWGSTGKYTRCTEQIHIWV